MRRRDPIKKPTKTVYVKTRGGKVINKNPRKKAPQVGAAGGSAVGLGIQRAQHAANVARAKEQREIRKIRRAERTTKPLTNAQLKKRGGDIRSSNPGRPFRFIDPITRAGAVRLAAGERTREADIRNAIRRADKTLNRKGPGQLAKRDKAIDTLRSLGGLVDKPSEVQKAGERQMQKFNKRTKKQLDEAAMGEYPVGQMTMNQDGTLEKSAAWQHGNKGPAAPNLKTVDDVLSGRATAQLADAAKKYVDWEMKVRRTVYRKLTKNAQGTKGGKKVAKLGIGFGINPDSTGSKLVTHGAKDVIDISANAVPSVYLPSKEVAQGHPVKAGKMLAQPYVDLVKHPGKSLWEHPVASALLVSGVYGGVGRGAGKGLRTSPSKTLRKAGSIAGREPTVLPHTNRVFPRVYSKNVITKQAQKARDKVRERRTGSKAPKVTDEQIRTATVERNQVTEDVRRVEREAMHKENDRVLGRRNKNADTATVLYAQDITSKTVQSLRKYRNQIESLMIPKDEPALRRTQQELIKGIDKAFKEHDPQKVHEVAKEYADLNTRLQQEMIDVGLLSEYQANKARLIPYAIQSGIGRPRTEADVKAAVKVAKGEVKAAAADLKAQKAAFQRVDYRKRGSSAEVLRYIDDALNLQSAEKRVKTSKGKLKGARRLTVGEVIARGGGRLTPAMIREHLAQNTDYLPEPAFVSHSPRGLGPGAHYVPAQGGVSVAGPKRTGKATELGLMRGDPEVLREQTLKSQGLLSAVRGWANMIGEFGYREPNSGPSIMKFAAADRLAQNLNAKAGSDGIRWRVISAAPWRAKASEIEGMIELADKATYEHFNKAIMDGSAEFIPNDLREGRFAVVPEATARELHAQARSLGADRGGRLWGLYGQTFRTVVLATSPKWLMGNIVEGTLRTAVAHAGPRSYWFGRKVLKELEARDAQYGMEARARTVGSGHYGMIDRQNVYVDPVTVFKTRSAQRAMARTAEFMQKPVPRGVTWLWRWWSTHIFAFNRRFESHLQTAMLGKVLREDMGLLDDRLFKSTEAAVRQAVDGMMDVSVAAEAGRRIDDMFGKYAKFSAEKRRAIAMYLPFVAWSLNAAKFVLVVLPRDHPVFTSLLASASLASDEWRKDKGLMMELRKVDGRLPPFLQGSIPGAGGSHLRLTRYTPFGAFASPGSVIGTIADSLLPQAMSIKQPLADQRDWKGYKLDSTGEQYQEAAMSFLSGIVPGFSIVHGMVKNEGDALERFRRWADPFMYTQPKRKKGKVAKRKSILDQGTANKSILDSGKTQKSILDQ